MENWIMTIVDYSGCEYHNHCLLKNNPFDRGGLLSIYKLKTNKVIDSWVENTFLEQENYDERQFYKMIIFKKDIKKRILTEKYIYKNVKII